MVNEIIACLAQEGDYVCNFWITSRVLVLPERAEKRAGKTKFYRILGISTSIGIMPVLHVKYLPACRQKSWKRTPLDFELDFGTLAIGRRVKSDWRSRSPVLTYFSNTLAYLWRADSHIQYFFVYRVIFKLTGGSVAAIVNINSQFHHISLPRGYIINHRPFS